MCISTDWIRKQIGESICLYYGSHERDGQKYEGMRLFPLTFFCFGKYSFFSSKCDLCWYNGFIIANLKLFKYFHLKFFKFFSFNFNFLLLCWVAVHWNIWKSSYNVSNISYLNSSPLLLFHPLSPDSKNNLNWFCFCVYLHVYTLFGPPPGRTCSTFLFSNFVEEKHKRQ
jgi:hypothetical protein